MAEHALLSASGSKRWLECPPSARLEIQFPDKPSSYADEGTHAHAWAEMLLRHYLETIPKAKRTKEAAELAKSDYHSKELEEYIEAFVDYVKGRLKALRKTCPDPVIELEQRLDFSTWVPEGFGRGDVILIADGLCEVIDLKYGKGVRVDAADSTQIRLYGLGAIQEFDMLYDIQTVRMTIYQPRIEDGVTSHEMPASELLNWGCEYVAPRARLAYEGGGEYNPGDEQCRWCRAKAKCKARAEQARELAAKDFALQDAALLTDAEIAEALSLAERFLPWIKGVQEFALTEALDGTKYEGWKVVEGRSNRKYADEIKVAEALKTAGYEDIYKPQELKGITEMEKALGKKTFAETLDGLIVKPAGKPALVVETDSRPEFNPKETLLRDYDEI